MNRDSELVLGLVHTVGTNCSDAIECLKDGLNRFSYTTEVIKVSQEIIKQFIELGNIEPDSSDEYQRIDFYMNLGNRIRCETRDNAILMKGVAAYIYNKFRKNNGGGPVSRKAYIIDSIKHPDEVDFLRKTYGDGFHLIGISDNYEKRKCFLVSRKRMTETDAEKILNRDDNEKEKNGQHTSDVYQQSDYFINASDSRNTMQENIYRLLDLLFGNAFISPTFEEYAMFRAYVASLRSADLSRQIGAVVANSQTQEIIAEGVNDCPHTFGGVYWPIEKDGKIQDELHGRDYTLGYDSNKKEQKNIIEKILANLQLENNLENYNKIKSSGIGTLTEYGRVVHSEMEALMMCARNNISARGCTMYVTTFPCHNCAKHIIAAGIKRVVYIEPYPKSKALEFYKREISQSEEDEKSKVIFIPFKGVGPHKFIDLFSMQSTRWYARIRKDKEGNVIKWDEKCASLRNPMSLYNYIDMEKAAFKQYAEETAIIRKGKEDE